MSKRVEDSRTNRLPRKLNVTRYWLPLLCRAVAVLIVAVPAVGKLYQYSHWVARFDAWGILWPEGTVILVGVVQISAILSLLFGIAGRVGASVLAVVMIVAMTTAGLDVMNAFVLGSSMVLVVLGAGPYAYWDPQFSDLYEMTGKSLPESETIFP